MQTNNAYATDIAVNMENAAQHMRPTLSLKNQQPLTVSTQGINNYIECLLSDAEQESCDRATD